MHSFAYITKQTYDNTENQNKKIIEFKNWQMDTIPIYIRVYMQFDYVYTMAGWKRCMARITYIIWVYDVYNMIWIHADAYEAEECVYKTEFKFRDSLYHALTIRGEFYIVCVCVCVWFCIICIWKLHMVEVVETWLMLRNIDFLIIKRT